MSQDCLFRNPKFRYPFFVCLSILMFASCGEDAETQPDQKEALNAWFEEKYEEELQMSPIQLTFLGRKDQYDKIDDLSL